VKTTPRRFAPCDKGVGETADLAEKVPARIKNGRWRGGQEHGITTAGERLPTIVRVAYLVGLGPPRSRAIDEDPRGQRATPGGGGAEPRRLPVIRKAAAVDVRMRDHAKPR
jgi:hypothetical protein